MKINKSKNKNIKNNNKHKKKYVKRTKTYNNALLLHSAGWDMMPVLKSPNYPSRLSVVESI